ncbi:MAG: phosphopentomutase [Nitrospirae bacterium RIFCSPHIGHO2_02_FULL_40_19]|nr:MAG: phosphopentomutase [Nitrospirae bacterium RIFCSPHIGHO2_02_FULL_40_19]
MEGFPEELINAFIQETGVEKILGNKAASGTEILKELGEEHVKTEYPIVYTSADSVFQIACHENIFPLEELYHICKIARRLCNKYAIGRVIARPFVGDSALDFKRTPNRKDLVYELPEPMLLDFLKEKQVPVISVGKISDIFNHQGISASLKTKSNLEGLLTSVTEMEKLKHGLVFTNLIDFDQLYGHRNDISGFSNALVELDRKLPEIMKTIGPDGLLIITSDHGNDPTHPGTDHTREYAPLLVYSPSFKSKNLGIRKTFSDIGQTVAEIFNLAPLKHGTSFLKELSS